jgi:GNAT superfamily N-acetyltransferase
MMCGVTNVRTARANDLDAHLALYAELSPNNAGTDRATAALAFDELLTLPHTTLLVAEDRGAVIGTVTLVVVPNLTHQARPWAQLENMVVTERVRGTGVGKTLLAAALGIAWNAGCYKVQLQSANHRSAAHRFYERNGFSASSSGYRLYRPRPPAP